MTYKLRMLLILPVIGFFQNVSAAPGDLAVGLKAGTLGAGLEFTVEAADRINLRFGGNYFKVSKVIDVEDNDYDLDLKLNSYTALADWYISDGSFRVTGGMVINNNALNGDALSSNTYEINDRVYTNAEVGDLSADVDFKSLAPYIGIGWGNPLADDSDWSFMVDLGVIFAGKPRLDIQSTGGTLSNNAVLQNDIAQAELDFQNTEEIKYLKYYPVISFGLNYRF
ncbi:MAG: hypothetical protein O2963_00595 [Proteobacteria bacterium]|jgi:hypothetical protein|nr:hypothetical protein [Pseudomonadota bacterium]